MADCGSSHVDRLVAAHSDVAGDDHLPVNRHIWGHRRSRTRETARHEKRAIQCFIAQDEQPPISKLNC